MSVSSKPDALVLYNPALGFPDPSRDEKRPQDQLALGPFISNWNVAKSGPPAILFFGTEDPLQYRANDFARQLIANGIRAEFYTAAGQKHGFFNDRGEAPWLRARAAAD